MPAGSRPVEHRSLTRAGLGLRLLAVVTTVAFAVPFLHLLTKAGDAPEVLGADGVRVEVKAAEVRHPGETGGVPYHGLLGGGAARVPQGGRVDVGRVVLGHTLLEERLLPEAIGEALQHHRPSACAAQRAVGDRDVVARQVELGQPHLREHDLVRMRDADLPIPRLHERLCPRTHAATVTAARLPNQCGGSVGYSP